MVDIIRLKEPSPFAKWITENVEALSDVENKKIPLLELAVAARDHAAFLAENRTVFDYLFVFGICHLTLPESMNEDTDKALFYQYDAIKRIIEEIKCSEQDIMDWVSNQGPDDFEKRGAILRSLGKQLLCMYG